ncbi:MAG: DUF2927 domain-containing protein, partial [Pseudomonadota bacterium]
RTDGGGPDTPFSARTLTQNFLQIALFNEYRLGAALSGPRGGSSPLRRWQTPVRATVIESATTPPAQRAQDTADVGRYLARLSQVTGYPIDVTDGGRANFYVFIVDEDDRRALGPQLRALVPGISEQGIAAITHLPRDIQCLVVAFSEQGSHVTTRAIAIIRAEHPDLLRRSCIHEELAQGLGLANDSPAARPSIFNDDEEFALLTRHDELLLTMLYDPRLAPGMTLEAVAPIANTIAREFFAGAS